MSNLCRSLEEPCSCARTRFDGQMCNRAKIPETLGFPEMPNPSVYSKNQQGMQNKACGGSKVDRPDAGEDSFRRHSNQESIDEYPEQDSQESSRHYWEPCRCCGQPPPLPPPPYKCCGRQSSQKSCGQQTTPPQGCYEKQQPPPPSQRCRNSQSPERRCCPENPTRPSKCYCQDKGRCCYPEDPPPPKRYCCPDSQPSPQRCCWQDNCQDQEGRKCTEKRRRKRWCTRRNCCSCECVVTHEIGIQTDDMPPCQPEPPIPDRIEIVDVTTQEREIRHRNGEVEIVVDEIQTITVVPNDGSAPTKRQVLIRTDSSNPNDPQIIETQLNEEIDPDSIILPDKALRYSQLEPIMTNLVTTPPSGFSSPSEVKDRRIYKTKQQYEQPTEHTGGKEVTKTVVNNTDDFLSPKRSPKILSPVPREVLSPKQRKSSNTNGSESKRRAPKLSPIASKVKRVSSGSHAPKVISHKYVRPGSKRATEANRLMKDSERSSTDRSVASRNKQQQDSREQIYVNKVKDGLVSKPAKSVKNTNQNWGKPTAADKVKDLDGTLVATLKATKNKGKNVKMVADTTHVVQDTEGNMVLKPVASDFSQLSTVHVKVTNRKEKLSQKAGRKSVHQDAIFETKISELRLRSPVSEEEEEPEPEPEPEPKPKPKKRKKKEFNYCFPPNDLVCRMHRPLRKCNPRPCRAACGFGPGAGGGAVCRRCPTLPCFVPCPGSMNSRCSPPRCMGATTQCDPIYGFGSVPAAYYCHK